MQRGIPITYSKIAHSTIFCLILGASVSLSFSNDHHLFHLETQQPYIKRIYKITIFTIILSQF